MSREDEVVIKRDVLIYKAIRERRDIEEPFLQLSTILKAGGISAAGYLQMCADRIAEADLLDDEDVRIVFERFPDLLLSSDGVWVCRDILEKYVSPGIWWDAYEILCLEEERRYHISQMAKLLRAQDLKGLYKMYQEAPDVKIKRWVLAEVYYRSAPAAFVRKVKKTFRCLVVRVKHRRLLSFVKTVAGKYVEKAK